MSQHSLSWQNHSLLIYGCDPELDVSSLTEIFADSISPLLKELIQHMSKQWTGENQHFGLTKDMAK